MTSLEEHDFADDLAPLSHRIQDMRDKTKALLEHGAKVGLKINATKTKTDVYRYQRWRWYVNRGVVDRGAG